MIGRYLYLSNTQSIEEKEIEQEKRIPKKMTLEKWIDQLILFESGGNEEIEIIDSNGKISAGCLQFQLDTFNTQIRKYGLYPFTEDNELANLWKDCTIQKELTRIMLRDNLRNCTHWYTSVYVRGLGEPNI